MYKVSHTYSVLYSLDGMGDPGDLHELAATGHLLDNGGSIDEPNDLKMKKSLIYFLTS